VASFYITGESISPALKSDLIGTLESRLPDNCLTMLERAQHLVKIDVSGLVFMDYLSYQAS